MTYLKLIISYDGTRFFGWQKTKTGTSIQSELEKAASCIVREKIEIEAASRTDRGVHAKGQVVQFQCTAEINPQRLRYSLNAVLPPEISVQSVEIVDEHFHPTLNAHSKEYHYLICNTPFQTPIHRLYSWHVHQPLDIEMMRQGASYLVGTHDFSAFSNLRSDDTIRTVEYVGIVPFEKDRLRIEMRADRFLYKMARNIAGTLVYIGQGKLSANCIPSLLASRDRKQAGITAPAHGLFLIKVFY